MSAINDNMFLNKVFKLVYCFVCGKSTSDYLSSERVICVSCRKRFGKNE